MGVARAEVIPQVATPPTLESSWSESGHIRMARFYGSDQFADFWLHWDASNLYIKGEIQDYTPSIGEGITPGQTHDGKRWNTQFDDSIQISIATNPSKYKAVAFSPSGQLWKIDDCTPPSITCLGSTATHPNPTAGKLDNPSASIPSSYIKTSKIVGGKWRFMLSLPASLFDLPTFFLNIPLAINFYHDSISNFVPAGKELDFKSDGKSTYTKLKKQGDTWVVDKEDYDGMPANEWSVYQGDRNKPTEWAIFTLSAADVLKPTVAKTPTPGFVTVSSTGRSFELNGKPFVVVSETALMPWLPLRGLYNGMLCDEHKNWLGKGDGCAGKDEAGKVKGKNRIFFKEELFKYPNVPSKKPIVPVSQVTVEGKDDVLTLSQVTVERKDDVLTQFSDTTRVDLKTQIGNKIGKEDGPDKAKWEEWKSWIENDTVPTCPTNDTVTTLCQAEGRGIAIRYFKELKKYGINTLSIFVESLDLTQTPIIFGKDKDGDIFGFLDRVIKLASDNNVRLILRLYDTYYYNDTVAIDSEGNSKAQRIGDIFGNMFFEKGKYSIHQERMKKLFDKYANEPTILGWDIVNEIDNKDRFNTASYDERKAWVEAIASYVKPRVKQLVFFSFLTWDPKDGDSYRGKLGEKTGEKPFVDYLGLDATLAYRMPNIDFASPHTYYAHIANPGQLPTDDKKYEFLPAIELARGIAYGFYQIRDGRPILDTEGGPQEFFVGNQYNILPDRLFNRKNDTEIFLNSIWTHFAAGGAGANTRWPHDLENNSGRTNQISPKWREALWAFKNEVGNIPWDGNKLRVDHLRQNSAGQSPIIPQYDANGIPTNSTLAGTTFTVARYDDKYAVVYAYNHDKQPLELIALPGDIAAKAKGGQAYVRAVEFGYTEDETLVYKLISNLNGASLQSVDVANKKFVLNSKVSDNVVLIISFDQALPPPSMIIPTDTPAPAPQPVSLPSPSLGVGVGMKGGMAVDPKGNSIPTGAKFAIGVSNDAVAKGQPITVRGNIQSDAKHNGTAELIVVALYKKSGTDCSAPKAGSEASEGYYVLGSKGYCRYIGESGKVNEGKQQSECYSTPRSKPVESWGADWQQWDGKLESLQSVKEIQLPITSDSIETLYDDLSVGYTGHVCLTFGYRLKGGDGSVFFNGDPIQFTVK